MGGDHGSSSRLHSRVVRQCANVVGVGSKEVILGRPERDRVSASREPLSNTKDAFGIIDAATALIGISADRAGIRRSWIGTTCGSGSTRHLVVGK